MRLPPCQNVLRVSFQERKRLLGSLIGTERQTSPQLPSRLCPGPGSQAHRLCSTCLVGTGSGQTLTQIGA